MKTLKHLVLSLFILLIYTSTVAQSQMGELRIEVKDQETKEPIAFANITVEKQQPVGGSFSDENGKAKILLDSGTYNVKVSVVGYTNLVVEGVKVKPNEITQVDALLYAKSVQVDEVTVVRFKKPIIKSDQNTYTYSPPEPPASTRSSRKDRKSTSGVSFLGQRKDETAYYVDDVRIANYPKEDRETYQTLKETGFIAAKNAPLSTFSSDVDVAAYANVRRFINSGTIPPHDAVRIEEMVNYFQYNYPNPQPGETFAVTTDMANCPWNESHKILRVGVNTENISAENLPPSNLVFLIDVSGSMQSTNKLELLKKSLELLVKNLRPEDRVAIVVYASSTGLVLPSTPGTKKEKIISALQQLQAGGSTAGGAGIQLAYKTAKENFIDGANNRVILATDGDFNVGISDERRLLKLIEEKRNDNIFLSVLGFGVGNLQDAKMELLADNGNGNYAYIDNLMEAKKVLVNEMGANINVVAKDAKFQIEFNPEKVQAYRLIGYENRRLKDEDFNDDTKDAGDIGSGHSVTAFYEIIPVGVAVDETVQTVDSLHFQQQVSNPSEAWALVKLRHKKPGKAKSVLEQHEVTNLSTEENTDFQFALAVVEFAMILRHSEYGKSITYEAIAKRAKENKGADEFGYRSEFIRLVGLAQNIDNRKWSSVEE